MTEFKEMSLTLITGGISLLSMWYFLSLNSGRISALLVAWLQFPKLRIFSGKNRSDAGASAIGRVLFAVLLFCLMMVAGILTESLSKEVVAQRDSRTRVFFRELSGVCLHFLDGDKEIRLRSILNVSDYEPIWKDGRLVPKIIKGSSRSIYNELVSHPSVHCQGSLTQKLKHAFEVANSNASGEHSKLTADFEWEDGEAEDLQQACSKIYYNLKNRCYSTPTHFAELRESEKRNDFVRSIAFIAITMSILFAGSVACRLVSMAIGRHVRGAVVVASITTSLLLLFGPSYPENEISGRIVQCTYYYCVTRYGAAAVFLLVAALAWNWRKIGVHFSGDNAESIRRLARNVIFLALWLVASYQIGNLYSDEMETYNLRVYGYGKLLLPTDCVESIGTDIQNDPPEIK